MPAAGDTLGRYRLEALLGQGGMGKVFRAFDDVLKRRVALKILLDEGALGTEGKSRLLREARAAAALHHENVVSVFDVGEIGGAPFIAIELVEGEPLRARIDTASVEQKLAWLVQVARALDAAHEAGLVHRDIKPENVIIRAKDGVAKVLDFGIAKSAATFATNETADAALATVTAQGTIVGTPTYMSPEQLRAEPLDGRCDQFAWGVMAYELIAQRLPWDAPDALGIVAQVLSRDPPPLRPDGGALSEAVVQTIARAMRKARDERFPSMSALMEALGPVGVPSGSGGSRALRVAAQAIVTGQTKRVEAADTVRAETAPAVASTRADVAAIAAQVTTPRRRPWRSIAALGGVATIALAALFALRHRTRPSDAATATTSSASASASTSTQPASYATPLDACTPAARTDATAGRELDRTGDWYEAVHRLEAATKEDPSCAAAFFSLFVVRSSTPIDPDVRDAYRRALALQAQLVAHDRDVLAAFRPLIGEPPDYDAAARALDALLARYPDDAALTEVAAAAWARSGLPAEHALALHERANALDPGLSDPWVSKSRFLVRAGREREAAALLDQCIARIPLSSDCRLDRVGIDCVGGAADKCLAGTRDWIAWSPRNEIAYHQLASALACEGAAHAAIVDALDGSIARTTVHRDWVRAHFHTRLALFEGRFVDAAKLQREGEAILADIPDAGLHWQSALMAVAIAYETKGAEAGAVEAAAWVGRGGAWSGDVNSLFMRPLVIAVAAPARAHATLVADRASWLEAVSEPATKRAFDPFLLSGDDGEMRAALGVAHEWVGPTAISTRDALVGHAALRLGDLAAAKDALERSVRNCNVFRDPWLVGRAHVWLGDTLAKLNDKAGACAAYEKILARWGDAKPKSTTADEARAHAKALGCAAR